MHIMHLGQCTSGIIVSAMKWNLEDGEMMLRNEVLIKSIGTYE